MGTHAFFKQKATASSGQNLQARAIGASGFASRAAGGAAKKDIAAAQALYKAGSLRATAKTAATNAPGPKKV